jgi:aconitate hydratase
VLPRQHHHRPPVAVQRDPARQPPANTWRKWACRKRTSTYATHRGDHLTAQRATFANPSCSTKWCDADGSVRTRFAGAHRAGRQGHACGKPSNLHGRKQPLIIIAGADYGQGSRDWAAKGVRLAGVEAIVAEGFERIHRTN